MDPRRDSPANWMRNSRSNKPPRLATARSRSKGLPKTMGHLGQETGCYQGARQVIRRMELEARGYEEQLKDYEHDMTKWRPHFGKIPGVCGRSKPPSSSPISCHRRSTPVAYVFYSLESIFSWFVLSPSCCMIVPEDVNDRISCAPVFNTPSYDTRAKLCGELLSRFTWT